MPGGIPGDGGVSGGETHGTRDGVLGAPFPLALPAAGASGQSQVRTVAVLADSDTRWKWGAMTARRIAPGARLMPFLLRGRATPTARQLGEVGIEAGETPEVTPTEFLDAVTAPGEERPQVVVLACVGGTVRAMTQALHTAVRDAGGVRPVVVTGYVGVVYEKLADGLLLRHGADIVLANSPHDADRFRAVFDGVGADASSVTGAALPFLGGEPYREPEGRPFTVVFAVQPSVPDNRRDRLYLLERAARHAERHPDRRVVVKLRSRPGEHTTHIEEFPYQKLAARVPGAERIEFVHGHMGEVLDTTDLLVTVSSTAALESMHRGIPTAVLTDLGIREALGNHQFLGSGALASFDELDDGALPLADREWLRRHGVIAEGDPFAEVRARVVAMVVRAGGGQLPVPVPFLTARTAPGYLPGVLARQGLAPDGRPTATATAQRSDAGPRALARRLARDAARAAYRHGVQRVAPAVRRWGQV